MLNSAAQPEAEAGSANAGPAAGAGWDLRSSIVPRETSGDAESVRRLLGKLLARRVPAEDARSTLAPHHHSTGGGGAAAADDRPAARHPGLSSDVDAAAPGPRGDAGPTGAAP